MKLLCTLLLFITFHIGISAQQPDRPMRQKATSAYSIGDKVQDFELKNVDGTMKSLASIENANGYIIIFTSNECPYAVGYEDRIVELNTKMARRGYPVVTINSNSEKIEPGDSFEGMIENAKSRNISFFYLRDDKGVYKRFGANKTPHVFLVDKNMILQYSGAIDDNAKDANAVQDRFVENAVMALERGELPSPNSTKAIGCPIKTENAGDSNGRRKGPPSPEHLLSRMDEDKDGKLSKDEVKGPLAQDFDNLDTNNDGVLTQEELSQMKPRERGARKN